MVLNSSLQSESFKGKVKEISSSFHRPQTNSKRRLKDFSDDDESVQQHFKRFDKKSSKSNEIQYPNAVTSDSNHLNLQYMTRYPLEDRNRFYWFFDGDPCSFCPMRKELNLPHPLDSCVSLVVSTSAIVVAHILIRSISYA